MSAARVMDEVIATMPASIGLLARVAAALRERGINIGAVDAYERDGVGTFMVVTEDSARAADALREMGADVAVRSVVAVDMPDRAGALEEVADTMAEAGVNILYAYGSVSAGAGAATIIFHTADDARAASLF